MAKSDLAPDSVTSRNRSEHLHTPYPARWIIDHSDPCPIPRPDYVFPMNPRCIPCFGELPCGILAAGGDAVNVLRENIGTYPLVGAVEAALKSGVAQLRTAAFATGHGLPRMLKRQRIQIGVTHQRFFSRRGPAGIHIGMNPRAHPAGAHAGGRRQRRIGAGIRSTGNYC